MDGRKVFNLAFAEIVDPLIVGLAFYSAVPAAIVINSVIVVFAICPVVLFVVGR